MADVLFDVYGFPFRLHFSAGAAEAAKGLASDFEFFRRPRLTGKPIEVCLFAEDPPYETVPARAASVYTPRNISFSEGPRTYIDYSGRALAIYDRQAGSFHIHSRDTGMLYEASYLFLLSRIGDYLDSVKLHRIHAMALSYRGRAVLAILPMGGGKSTLCAGLLKNPEFDFLSDDSPFIADDGSVRAFPLRIGLLPGGEAEVPPQFRRTIQRMEFGAKVLANYEWFAHRIQPAAEPGIVFLGYRSLAEKCRIEPAGTRESYRSMIADCAIGLGLFQGLEFVVRSSPWELAAKMGTGWSRLSNARRLFQRSEVYRLILGRNHEDNARAVTELVKERLSGRRG